MAPSLDRISTVLSAQSLISGTKLFCSYSIDVAVCLFLFRAENAQNGGGSLVQVNPQISTYLG